MYAMFVNREPELLDNHKNIVTRKAEVMAKDPEAEVDITTPHYCGHCQSPFFTSHDALFCPCDDPDYRLF